MFYLVAVIFRSSCYSIIVLFANKILYGILLVRVCFNFSNDIFFLPSTCTLLLCFTIDVAVTLSIP